jgi:hypothetical protein
MRVALMEREKAETCKCYRETKLKVLITYILQNVMFIDIVLKFLQLISKTSNLFWVGRW